MTWGPETTLVMGDDTHPADSRLSPYTGWTRAHWEATADRMLLAVRPHAGPGNALVSLPGGAPRSAEPERRGEATRAILADRGFLVFMLACLMASAVYLQANATFPLWVKANGYSNAVYGGLISVNGVVIILAELLLISFTQKFEARRVIAAGFLLVGVGFALTAVAHTIARGVAGHRRPVQSPSPQGDPVLRFFFSLPAPEHSGQF